MARPRKPRSALFMGWMAGFIPSTTPLVDLRESQLRIPPRSSRTVAATLFICGTLECATQPGHRSSPRAAGPPSGMGRAARGASAIARARAASGRSDMSDAFLAARRPGPPSRGCRCGARRARASRARRGAPRTPGGARRPRACGRPPRAARRRPRAARARPRRPPPGVAEAHRPLEEPGRHPRLSGRGGTSRRADPRADIVPLAGPGPIRPGVCWPP